MSRLSLIRGWGGAIFAARFVAWGGGTAAEIPWLQWFGCRAGWDEK
jgi:hypothetical protein